MLLSIKPKYAKVILEGKNNTNSEKTGRKMVWIELFFYASSPQKEVVGEASIDEILDGTPNEIWEIARTAAGITKKFYFPYYAGKDKAIAYKLKDVVICEKPRALSDYGIRQAPQSFVYL